MGNEAWHFVRILSYFPHPMMFNFVLWETNLPFCLKFTHPLYENETVVLNKDIFRQINVLYINDLMLMAQLMNRIS